MLDYRARDGHFCNSHAFAIIKNGHFPWLQKYILYSTTNTLYKYAPVNRCIQVRTRVIFTLHIIFSFDDDDDDQDDDDDDDQDDDDDDDGELTTLFQTSERKKSCLQFKLVYLLSTFTIN